MKKIIILIFILTTIFSISEAFEETNYTMSDLYKLGFKLLSINDQGAFQQVWYTWEGNGKLITYKITIARGKPKDLKEICYKVAEK